MTHYLDYAATTPVRPEAAQAAYEAMIQGWGNPSSGHRMGRQAAQAVKNWRSDLAAVFGCREEEIYFTSCGTESSNWAILGAADRNRRKKGHIITTAMEHDAVRKPCAFLEKRGFEVTYLLPDRWGEIQVEQVEQALREDTILVSMMLVNNELGTILPVEETARMLRRRGSLALLHCDGVQALLKVPFTPQKLGVDLMSFSGHKIGAPKGIGALYLRKGLRFPSLLHGGGQESGLRGGTEATSQIAAFAAAARCGAATFQEDVAHMSDLKSYAIDRLRGELPELQVLTRGGAPHILPISMSGYQSEVVVRFLSDLGIYISSGSACHKGKPSHVYAALGLEKKTLDGALRVSLSGQTKQEDIDALVAGLKRAREDLFQSLS